MADKETDVIEQLRIEKVAYGAEQIVLRRQKVRETVENRPKSNNGKKK